MDKVRQSFSDATWCMSKRWQGLTKLENLLRYTTALTGKIEKLMISSYAHFAPEQTLGGHYFHPGIAKAK